MHTRLVDKGFRAFQFARNCLVSFGIDRVVGLRNSCFRDALVENLKISRQLLGSIYRGVRFEPRKVCDKPIGD